MEELATAVNGGNGYSGKYFLLTRDLTSEDDTIRTVIGNSTVNVFRGTFDGGGHEVAVNINVTSVTSDTYRYGAYYVCAGVFGCIAGTIKNLGVSGSVSASNPSAVYAHAGGIVAFVELNALGSISMCYNAASVSSSSTAYTFSGGICSYVQSDNYLQNNIYSISNCYNIGNIISSSAGGSDNAGGIYGAGFASISNCYNKGSISMTGAWNGAVGGIYGHSIITNLTDSLRVSNCFNVDSVDFSTVLNKDVVAHSGGISGRNNGGIFSNCYNSGSVSTSVSFPGSSGSGLRGSGSGGIFGGGAGTYSECYNTGEISASSSFASGSFNCNDRATFSGGIGGSLNIGATYSANISNCYNTGNVSSYSSYTYPSPCNGLIKTSSGGICGNVDRGLDGDIFNCYNTGSIVSSVDNAIPNSKPIFSSGGICGDISQLPGGHGQRIYNCYNTAVALIFNKN
ncbi:hypothetical protein AGMMS49965_24810 [Bacteroidia bacterium]|nr:hypothetical protein AGMMS49965_24810 [Bacteroidia bacterium]